MTPFMIRVAELMEIDVTDPEALEELEALAPMPNTCLLYTSRCV